MRSSVARALRLRHAATAARRLARAPPWPPPRVTCWSRCCRNSRPPFSGCAPASRRGRRDRLRGGARGDPRRSRQGAGDSARARRRRHDPRPADRATARTRRCSTRPTRRGPLPASTASRPGSTSRSRPAGRTSPRSCCSDSSQFRADPPYDVTTRRYAADFAEVKRLGGDGVTTPSDRTAEQTEIARFWVESSPLQWNRIARNVSASQGSIRGRRRACSACSTWPSRTATSAPSRPSTSTTTGAR